MKLSRSGLGFLFALALVSPAFAEGSTLSLTAEGTVHAAPDTAVVSLGVVEQAETAGEALTKNSAAMEALIKALKDAKIADKDIATSNFSIDPVTVYPPVREDGSQPPPQVTGYRVSNQLVVTIRDIASAGSILDQVVRIGANQVSGIAFKVENDKALMDDARRAAMKEVTDRAKVYAEAGGFKLGKIMSISESGGSMPFQDYPVMPMVTLEKSSVPLAPGERALSVNVSVVWEIIQN